MMVLLMLLLTTMRMRVMMVLMMMVTRAMMTEVVTVSLLVTEVSLLCCEAPIPDRRSGGVSGGKGAGGWHSLFGGVVPIWIERGIDAPPPTP